MEVQQQQEGLTGNSVTNQNPALFGDEGQEIILNREEIDQAIKEAVEQTLQNQPYHHNKVSQWNSNIVELCLKKLSALNKPFKFIVTCVIMQKNGAGIHAATSCYWDPSTDSSFSFQYDSKTMYAIVNVFALAI